MTSDNLSCQVTGGVETKVTMQVTNGPFELFVSPVPTQEQKQAVLDAVNPGRKIIDAAIGNHIFTSKAGVLVATTCLVHALRLHLSEETRYFLLHFDAKVEPNLLSFLDGILEHARQQNLACMVHIGMNFRYDVSSSLPEILLWEGEEEITGDVRILEWFQMFAMNAGIQIGTFNAHVRVRDRDVHAKVYSPFIVHTMKAAGVKTDTLPSNMQGLDRCVAKVLSMVHPGGQLQMHDRFRPNSVRMEISFDQRSTRYQFSGLREMVTGAGIAAMKIVKCRYEGFTFFGRV